MTVRTEIAHLTTTGGKVWDAAYRMFDFLKAVLPSQGDMKILELGSGCGWLGMSLADYFGERCTIVMTEQENGGGLDWLRHNLSLNPRLTNCRAEALDWCAVPDMFTSTKWDYIIGSELVYSPITCRLLPQVMYTLSDMTTQIYYAHNLNRFEMLDIELIHNITSTGFSVKPMLGDNLSTTLSTNLFPDMTLEIYTISKQPQ